MTNLLPSLLNMFISVKFLQHEEHEEIKHIWLYLIFRGQHDRNTLTNEVEPDMYMRALAHYIHAIIYMSAYVHFVCYLSERRREYIYISVCKKIVA
jgi:hypothetical protein